MRPCRSTAALRMISRCRKCIWNKPRRLNLADHRFEFVFRISQERPHPFERPHRTQTGAGNFAPHRKLAESPVDSSRPGTAPVFSNLLEAWGESNARNNGCCCLANQSTYKDL